MLVEAAWSYRHPARVSETLRARLEALPKTVRDIAWKAQVRLCGRYRRLNAAGKKLPVIIAAIAREMAAFLWAIGRQVTPAAVTDNAVHRPPLLCSVGDGAAEGNFRRSLCGLPDAPSLDRGKLRDECTEGGR